MSPATSGHTMNGSLPPISRFIRATRSAHTEAIFLPVATEPGEGHAVHALVGHDGAAHVAGAGQQRQGPGGQVVEHRRQHQRGQRRDLRRLGHHRVARRQRRGELPGQQQQRVVPGHDGAHHAHRLLGHQGQLRRLDRRDHPPGRGTAQLGVEVERRRGPVDLVGVLDQRLAALQRHHARQLVLRRAEAGGHLVQHLAPLERGGPGPDGKRLGGRRDGGVHLCGRGRADVGDGLLGGRVLDGQGRALAVDLLSADQ